MKTIYNKNMKDILGRYYQECIRCKTDKYILIFYLLDKYKKKKILPVTRLTHRKSTFNLYELTIDLTKQSCDDVINEVADIYKLFNTIDSRNIHENII